MCRSFPPDIARIFVVPKRNEFGVPEVIVGRPLHEFGLADEFRPEPLAILHLRRRKALSPAARRSSRADWRRDSG